MNIFSRIKSAAAGAMTGWLIAAGPIANNGRRSYSGAGVSRLTNDWLMPHTSGDAELRGTVKNLRARSREAERNDDYMRRYYGLLENNVLGAFGIAMQMKIQDPNGALDRLACSAVENAWALQGKKKNCCVNRRLTWRGLQRLVLRSAKRDGGVLVHFIRGYDNDFKYALQLYEIDQLDENYNAVLPGNREIRMGVEIDENGAPLAYHLWTQHPGDMQGSFKPKRRVRIPVQDMLHIFLPDRISQTLGAPAPSATLLRLKMLSGYEEAELVAAREAACKGYGIKKATPEGFSGETDGQARSLQDIEPGMGLELNPGEEYFSIDPQHPTQAFPNFLKSMLRAIAGGLGVSYNSLANDLESVNYSSLRAGLLDEREEWKGVQQWLIEELCEPVFEDWLSWTLSFGFIRLPNGSALPVSKFDKFNAPDWKPRRWAWVDPMKDMQANVIAVEKGFNSRRRIIAEEGRDIEEVFMEQSEDRKLEKSFGLTFPIEGVEKSPGEEGEDVTPSAPAASPAAK